MQIPNHVAFIMDGNRRWAKKNSLALVLGHDTGAKRIEPLVERAEERGVKFVTFWAFSTENWSRPKREVEQLMDVFRMMLKKDSIIERLKNKGVKIVTIGDIERFPKDIVLEITRLSKESLENKGIQATFALSYGGRDEVIAAVKRIRDEQKEITEEEFDQYLFTKDIPDPDLIIRTGGVMRTSGFMPWQAAYSEWYFTDTLWPDFGPSELDIALEDYLSRERRFGK